MDRDPSIEAFENVKDQVGVCGIWCGSCIAGNGALRELTRRYRALIKAYDLQDWAPKTFDFDEFVKGLQAIEGMPVCAGCLKGGGRDKCEMRTCAAAQGHQNCLACSTPGRCKHADLLEKMRSGARSAGLGVLADDVDREEQVNAWTAQTRRTWPCCAGFGPSK